jgi:signal transduction histidine kinase
VVLRKSEDSIVAPIRKNMVNNLIIASLGVILVIGLSVWTSRSITRRVQSAVTATNMVAAGNLTADISVLQDSSQDEMGQLTDALDKMAESLKNKMKIINNISVGNYSLQAHPETEADILGYALKNMAENLKNVVAHAGLIAEGNYEQTLIPRSEHDELTISLNRMTQALSEVHNTLEQRVAELETTRNEAVLLAREAEAANKSKSVFLANVSHEIRTPINAITGFAEILGGQITDPQQKQYIASIKSSSDSLLNLFSDILDLSRLEAGDLHLNLTDVDLLMAFTNIENIFGSKAAGKGLAFHLKLDPELPRSVELDEKRFLQIFYNLLDNAVKFTKLGDISVEAKAELTHNKVALYIDISDTGIGIPDDQIEKVFAPFTQRQDQSINEYGGTGLGLTLTKRLLDAMGGSVTATSQVSVGSTFHVVLDDVHVVDNTP